MEGLNPFRRKTSEELKAQVTDASTILNTPLARPDIPEPHEANTEELKFKYKERYNAYLRLLRNQRNGKEIDQSELKETQQWIQALNNLDHYIENHKLSEKERILRHRQFTIFEDIRNCLEKGITSGYIKLPTGTGKTVLFSQIIESLGLKTLITVPSRILVTQTGDRLEKFTDLEYGSIFSENKDFSKPTTITTYSSLLKQTKIGNLSPKEFKLLVLDEAHRALGPETKKVIGDFKSIKLGFTATPNYSKDKSVKDILPEEIHSMSVLEAAREGLINRFKVILAETEVDLTEIKTKSNGEYDDEELEKAINIPSRNIAAVNLYKKAFSNKQGVAYCAGVDHAKKLTALFVSQGIPAAYITGETSASERKDILKRYNSGEIKMLCNARVLIEGFDEKNASVCLNLAPTRSHVDAEQRAGRVLRLDEDNPNKWAYIIDFVDKHKDKSPVLFSKIAEEAQAISQEDEFAIRERNNFPEGTSVYDTDDPFFDELKILENISIDGLKVILDTTEVMRVTRQFDENNPELAPEGWKTRTGIAVELDYDPKTIKRYLEKLNLGPSDKKVFPVGKGALREHYSPDVFNKAREYFQMKDTAIEVKGEAPSGWRTAVSLERQFNGIHTETIKKYALEIGAQTPGWFGIYLNTRNIPVEHYAPELVQKIVEKISAKEYMSAPAGWTTSRTLMKILHVHNQTVKDRAETFRTDHPEWFGIYKIRANQAEHYSPELVNEILQSFGKPKLELKQNNAAPEIISGEEIQQEDITQESITLAENDIWLKEYLITSEDKSLLSRDQERVLIQAAQSGDLRARNELVERNVRLATWIANKYRDTVEVNNILSFEDLIQEADAGLFRAIDKFDLSKGTKFSTYAYLWIRQYIQRFLDDHSKEIRIPANLNENIRKYNRIYKNLKNDLGGSEPTVEQLSKATNLDADIIVLIQDILNRKIVTLDTRPGSESSNGLGNISDQSEKQIDEVVNSILLQKDIKEFLQKNLKKKEYTVLSLRYGLDGQGEHTLEEIGERYSLSRERIRQIEERAKAKLMSDPEILNIVKELN